MPSTFTLNGATLTIASGQIDTLAGSAIFNGGEIIGPGTLLTTGSVAITAETFLDGDLTWINTGIVTGAAPILLDYPSGAGSILISNATAGIFDITADGAPFINESSGGNIFTNSGLLEKTAGSLVSNFGAFIINTGTIDAAAGTLLFQQGGTLAGTLTGAGAIELAIGTFTLSGALAADPGAFILQSGTVNLTRNLALPGVIDATGAQINLNGNTLSLAGVDIFSTGEFSGPGMLLTTGAIALTNQTFLDGGLSWLNTGTVLSGSDFLLDYPSGLGAITITNAGVYNFAADGAAFHNQGSQPNLFINTGLLEKTGGYGLSQFAMVINSSGAINAAAGVLEFDSGGTLAGSLTGAGAIALAGGIFTLAPGIITTGTLIADGSAAINLTGNLTLAAGFDQSGGQLNLNGATMKLGGPDILSGGTLSGPGTVVIARSAAFTGIAITGGALILDTGTIAETGFLDLGNVSATDSAAISIAIGGIYDLLNDADIFTAGTAFVQNSGLFLATGGDGAGFIAPRIINGATGTLAIAADGLQLTTLLNDGLVTISNASLSIADTVTANPGRSGIFRLGGNATLDASGGIAATQMIALSGTGNVVEIASETEFAATITGFTTGDTIDVLDGLANGVSYHNNILTLTSDGATVETIALSSLANAGSISLAPDQTGGTLIEFANPGQILNPIPSTGLSADPWQAGSGNLATAANWGDGLPGTLAIASFASTAGSITVTQSAGAVTADQLQGNDSTATLLQTGGTLALLNGGTWSGAFSQSGGEIIDDSGILQFQSITTIAGTFAGTGEIAIAGGITTLAAPAVLNTASFSLESNAELIITSSRTYAGAFYESGTIALDGQNLTLTGPALLQPGATISGSGTLTLAGRANLSGADINAGAALAVTGTALDTGGLTLGDSGSDSNTLQIAGTMVIAADQSIGNGGGAATQSVINAGFLEKTGDTGTSYIESNLTQTSTGTIAVTAGTLDLYGGIDTLGGTLLGHGRLQLDSANVTLAPGLAMEIGAIGLGPGSALTLAATESFAGIFTLAGDIALNAHNLTLTGGTAIEAGNNVAGAQLAGPGTLAIADAYITGLALTGGALLRDTGVINLAASGLSLGQSAGDHATLAIAAGALLNLLGSNEIAVRGNAVISNAGLLEQTNFNGINDIFASLTNSGMLLATDGLLQIETLTNLSRGVLNSGTYAAESGGFNAVLSLASGGITVDAADIILGGPDSELVAGGTLIETTLHSITSAGRLAFLSGRNFTAANTITDSGHIVLQNIDFTAPSLTIAHGGLVFGHGTINAPVTDNGLIEVSGTTLTLADPVSGTGSLLIQSNTELILDSSIAPTALITFGASLATLGLAEPFALPATLTGFGPSDTIDVFGTLASSARLAGTELFVTLSGGKTLSTALPGINPQDRVAINPDGNAGTDISLFRPASPGTIAPPTLNLGQFHTGQKIAKTFTVSNTAATGPYSENLDATITAQGAPITATGSITGLAAGSRNSTALQATLASANAGIEQGIIIISLATDGTGLAGDGLAPLSLGAQTITLSGALFNEATASPASPAIINDGELHIGARPVNTISIGNLAAAGKYSENLDASFSGTSAELAASGTIAGLAGGDFSTNALHTRLLTTIAGVQSGTATLALTSDSHGIDTLASTQLAPQTITITGTLFNDATASATPGLINFGIVHTGQTIGEFITLSNLAATGHYSENLDASFSGTSGSLLAGGTISALAAGASSTQALGIELQTAKSGTLTGKTEIILTSDGKGIDTLASTSLGAEALAITGTVNNYATAHIEALSGPGTLTGSGTNLTLNLGDITQSNTAATENLGIWNAATGLADLLSGSLTVSGSTAFSNAGLNNFGAIAAGGTDTAPEITLSASTLGTFSETIILDATGSNASGYAGTLAAQTLRITGTIVAAALLNSSTKDIMRFAAPAPKREAENAAALTGAHALSRDPPFIPPAIAPSIRPEIPVLLAPHPAYVIATDPLAQSLHAARPKNLIYDHGRATKYDHPAM
jgi:hypothetical protein